MSVGDWAVVRATPEEELRMLRERVAALRIGPPLYALLDPRVEVVCVDPVGQAEVSVRISTPDRGGAGAHGGLETRFTWTRYMVRQALADGRRAAEYVRSHLLAVLEHELDESLWLGGERLHEPLHWGPDWPPGPAASQP